METISPNGQGPGIPAEAHTQSHSICKNPSDSSAEYNRTDRRQASLSEMQAGSSERKAAEILARWKPGDELAQAMESAMHASGHPTGLVMFLCRDMLMPLPDEAVLSAAYDDADRRFARRVIDAHRAQGVPAEAKPSLTLASELGIADTLAGSELPMRVRYLAGEPRIWDGRRWAACADRIPAAIQGAVHQQVGEWIASTVLRPNEARHLESAGAVRGICAFLAGKSEMQLDPQAIDPPGLLVTPSTCIDLHSGERLPHDPARPVTRCAGIGPGEATDHWTMIETHLAECLGPMLTPVHRFLGSALVGRGADRRLLWLHGPGGDGKSTLCTLLRIALGDYAFPVPAEVFGQGARGAHGHELAAGMAGARLALVAEVGLSLDWPKLKGLSGGDAQVTKRLHGRAFGFDRPPHLVLVSNGPPAPPDNAARERLLVAELRPPVEPDERLAAILKDGGPERDALAGACLSWLLRGCADYLADGPGPVPVSELWLPEILAAEIPEILAGARPAGP